MASPSVNYNGNATSDFDHDTEVELESELPNPEEHTPEKGEPKPKRVKTTTSDVWKSFSKIGLVDGKEKAKCNGCGKLYVVSGSQYGTSTLSRYIPKCVALPKYHNIGTMMLDAQGKLRSRQLDHKHMREVIAMAIVEHDLPYSFVEYRRVRELLYMCNPDNFIDFSSDDHAIKKSELDIYLEEGKLDAKYHIKMDVLQYWKEHHGRFQCLSKMAIDILSIPIITVASESSFSIGSRVLTKYRCSLLSKIVQAIICARNWLQGFACEDDEDNLDDLSMDYKASNVVNVDD
nr:zinc finger BED domain-containing protein RICESLEEPER 2-like [Ipomoea batatas]